MSVETEFPSLTRDGAIATAEDIAFYLDGYDIVVNRVVAGRGPKEFLGEKPPVCRFCTKTAPEVTFRKEAHAIPELAGNGTLLSFYECDDCNNRFSAFEDDLGKLTLLERIAGQVLGKTGVPSARTGQKRSRIDVDLTGFKIREHEGDPIAQIDHEAKTLTISIPPQPYRPLGVFKALVKVALTLMDERDLAKVPEALRWLRAADLTTDQIDDGTRYSCIRSFTPGPAPFAATRAFLLRRKRPDVSGPALIFILAFGNLSFQIVVPAPQEDRDLIGKAIQLRTVPVVAFQDQGRVRGPTRFGNHDLSSPTPVKGPQQIIFHFDEVEDVTGRHPLISLSIPWAPADCLLLSGIGRELGRWQLRLVEPNQPRGYCDSCSKNSVVGGLVLADFAYGHAKGVRASRVRARLVPCFPRCVDAARVREAAWSLGAVRRRLLVSYNSKVEARIDVSRLLKFRTVRGNSPGR
jgi:hypothetical protein